MMMSEKSKQHVDSCRFCWMCHHICPIGNATGQERNTARARALGISLVNREAIDLSEIMDNIYECCTCGACVHDCTTGWDPVMFTKETRLLATLEDKLPPYINTLVDNCLDTGSAYGKTALCDTLAKLIAEHEKATDTLLLLGADVRAKACRLGKGAIEVLASAGVSFTLLADEPATGAQLDFLIGKAEETKEQMLACAKVLNGYKTVVVYDPADAKTIKQLYGEYGVEVTAEVKTFTSYVASLLTAGKLTAKQSGKKVVYQDPYQLSRDLGECEEPRAVIAAYADLSEMLLSREETVFAGSLLMAEYMPEVMKKVASRRIFNATSIGADTLVTASPAEYVLMKSVAPEGFTVLSLEELILA